VSVVAAYNIKGGVGKTSVSVNLAWLAAEAGARVLLWDLDLARGVPKPPRILAFSR